MLPFYTQMIAMKICYMQTTNNISTKSDMVIFDGDWNICVGHDAKQCSIIGKMASGLGTPMKNDFL